MQHEKKYNLIVEPRDVFKDNDGARTFPQFQDQQVIIMVTELKQQVIISNNDPLFHLNDLFLKFSLNNNLFKTMENCMKTRLTDCVQQKINLPQVWYILNK